MRAQKVNESLCGQPGNGKSGHGDAQTAIQDTHQISEWRKKRAASAAIGAATTHTMARPIACTANSFVLRVGCDHDTARTINPRQ